MEIILAVLAQQALPILGAALTALCTWGFSILKNKTKIDQAKSALDQVDQVVGTVVAGLSQTAVEAMKAAAADGKLTGEDKIYLKTTALEQAKDLLSDSVVKAASVTVANLESYINQKIEERVLAQKK